MMKADSFDWFNNITRLCTCEAGNEVMWTLLLLLKDNDSVLGSKVFQLSRHAVFRDVFN
jgi:hypothetical protein